MSENVCIVRMKTIYNLQLQFTPDLFLAEQFGLRNTTSWWSKDLASEL
jgi:hypothetical protein